MRVARVLDGFVVFWTCVLAGYANRTGGGGGQTERAAQFDRTSGMLLNQSCVVVFSVQTREKTTQGSGAQPLSPDISWGGWVVLRY